MVRDRDWQKSLQMDAETSLKDLRESVVDSLNLLVAVVVAVVVVAVVVVVVAAVDVVVRLLRRHLALIYENDLISDSRWNC